MLWWRDPEGVPADAGPTVVTIGMFDGVHQGHQRIINRAVQRAAELELPSVVLTFDPHPALVLRGQQPPILTLPERKIELLADLGVDAVYTKPFTVEFSHESPEVFAAEVLVDSLHAAAVVVGENFRFGHRAAGDLGQLHQLGRKYGFDVEGVTLMPPDSVDVSDEESAISSTMIRSAIANGDATTAAHALGRDHRVSGVVVRGDGRGRDLGYPTANLDVADHLAIPADGVYAGRVHYQGKPFAAAISVGTNPTFAGTSRRVEAFLLNFDADLYGDHLDVDFVTRLRDMQRFESIDDLVAAMEQDVRQTKDLLT